MNNINTHEMDNYKGGYFIILFYTNLKDIINFQNTSCGGLTKNDNCNLKENVMKLKYIYF